MKTLPCILALAESSLEPRGLDGLNRQGPDSKTLLLLKGTQHGSHKLGDFKPSPFWTSSEILPSGRS